MLDTIILLVINYPLLFSPPIFMKSLNVVHLIGNLTKDPEIKAMEKTDNVLCRFSIAVNEVWYNKQDEKQEYTSFFDCTCWGKRGEALAKFHQKGDPIFISGKLRQDKWEDKNGDKRYSVSIIVDDFIIIKPYDGDDKNDRGGSRGSSKSSSSSRPSRRDRDDGDDLPRGKGEVEI